MLGILVSHNPNENIVKTPIGGLGGSGVTLISSPSSDFKGFSDPVKILGVLGILSMWQLVFVLCHRLIFKKKNNNKTPKGFLKVKADFTDLGHGKNMVLHHLI